MNSPDDLQKKTYSINRRAFVGMAAAGAASTLLEACTFPLLAALHDWLGDCVHVPGCP